MKILNFERNKMIEEQERWNRIKLYQIYQRQILDSYEKSKDSQIDGLGTGLWRVAGLVAGRAPGDPNYPRSYLCIVHHQPLGRAPVHYCHTHTPGHGILG